MVIPRGTFAQTTKIYSRALKGRALAFAVLSSLALSGCAVRITSLKFPSKNSPIEDATKSAIWPFNVASESLYSFDPSKIQFTGGLAQLISQSQSDHSNATVGFGPGRTSGLLWDSSVNGIRLDTVAMTAPEMAPSNWMPQPSHIAALWHMNEAAGTTGAGSMSDSSGSGAVGTPFTGTIFGETAQVGTGVRFDGSNYVEVPQTPSLKFTGNGTICAWVNPSSDGTLVQIGSYDDWGFAMDISSGKISGRVVIDGVGAYFVSSTASISSGVWSLACIVRDGTSFTAFLNGIASAPSAINGGPLRVFNNAPSSIAVNFQASYLLHDLYTGSLDEVGVWSAALTAAEVKDIYEHQQNKYLAVGTFTSRVMDALSPGQAWNSLGWTSSLPFGKNLPDAVCSGATCVHVKNETTTTYSSLVGSNGLTNDNDLMQDILALWHLDEATTGTAPSGKDFRDDSGAGHHGTLSGDVTPGQSGKLGNAANFGATSSSVNFGPGIALDNHSFTISLWARRSSTNAYDLMLGQGAAGTNNSLQFGYRSAGVFTFAFYADDLDFATNSSDLSWHHWVGTYNDATLERRVYEDGVLVGGDTASGHYIGTGNFLLGKGAWHPTDTYFHGSLDEVAIWGRVLTTAEIFQVYRRGANRVKFQVRNCGLVDCSDDSNEANWKGPDGTRNTYFSELNNNTVPNARTGYTLPASPTLPLGSFTSPVSTSQYFQYHAVLESDDTSTACTYASVATRCSPDIQAVNIGPDHVSKDAPTIYGKTGYSFKNLSRFTETLGSCTSGVVYNIGIGDDYTSASWYWWDGTAWSSTAEDVNHSNSASVVQIHMSDLQPLILGNLVFVKSFLKSDGSSACNLNQIQIDGVQ